MADLQTLAATLSGPDRPGITHALMSAVAGLGTEVLDLEQVVVRGQVTIALLLGSLPDDLDRLEDRLAGTAARLGYRLTIEEGLGDNPPRPRRVVVTILGRPLRATHLAAVGRVVSEHGGNIDRVRRLSRTPMTTLEFMVSNAEVAALR